MLLTAIYTAVPVSRHPARLQNWKFLDFYTDDQKSLFTLVTGTLADNWNQQRTSRKDCSGSKGKGTGQRVQAHIV